MLNLFILVLMQNFEDNYINEDNPISAFQEISEIFKEQWITYCQSNQMYYIHEE